MRRIILVLTLMFALALPAYAMANPYAGIKIVGSLQSTGTISGNADGYYNQDTVGGALFAGYDFYYESNLPVRVEVEYTIRSEVNASIDYDDFIQKSDINYSMHTFFGNAYFDFQNNTALTPYVGAGLGAGFINNDRGNVATVFAWNVGAGVAYAFTESVTADLGYRFVGLGENQVRNATFNPFSNEVTLGLRFSF